MKHIEPKLFNSSACIFLKILYIYIKQYTNRNHMFLTAQYSIGVFCSKPTVSII